MLTGQSPLADIVAAADSQPRRRRNGWHKQYTVRRWSQYD